MRGNVEVTGVTQSQTGRVRVGFPIGSRGAPVRAGQLRPGLRRRQQPVRTAIGAHMEGLPFDQRWLVIDVDSDGELDQWEGCHQLCGAERAATYMRVGETRYRWEFLLLEGETAANYQSIAAICSR